MSLFYQCQSGVLLYFPSNACGDCYTKVSWASWSNSGHASPPPGQIKQPGPFKYLPADSDCKPASHQVDYTSLTLNTHSPLAPEVFSMVLWLSFASLSPLVPSSCLRHSRPWQMRVLWPPPHSLVFCTNTEWPQLFLTTSSLTVSYPHLTIKCRWLFWESPNGSVRVTQHLLGACSILGTRRRE